jgi:hypothetical protein
MTANSERTRDHDATAARRLRRAWIIGAWAVAAYLIAPYLWEISFRDRPEYAQAPHLTHTADGHPGDPITASATRPLAPA